MDTQEITIQEKNETNITGKNTFLTFFESIACILIIFIHIHFPGIVGSIMIGLAKFGVPLFFVIAGFYLFKPNITKEEIRNKLKVRIIRISILLLFSSIIYFCLGIISNRSNISSWLEDTFNWKQWVYLLLFNKAILVTPNWFLIAMIFSYIIIYIFANVFIRYKSAIIFIIALLPIWIALKLVFLKIDVSIDSFQLSTIFHASSWYNNGLPFICLGGLLRYYKSYFRKIKLSVNIIVLICSVILMVVEAVLFEKYFNGGISYYLGNIICVCSIIILVNNYPNVMSKSKFLHQKGNWQMYVYIFHSLVINFVGFLFKRIILNESLVSWISPIIVVILTLILALLFNKLVVFICSKMKNKKIANYLYH